VLELTRGSDVTHGRHLAAPEIVEAGWPGRRSAAQAAMFFIAPSRRGSPAGRLDEPLRRFLAATFHESSQSPERDRSMSNAAFKADTQQIVVDEVFPHAPENDLENADHR